ncbi:MAG: hypothetical protein ACD_79C00570G0005, partial [uncultured bacterium]
IACEDGVILTLTNQKISITDGAFLTISKTYKPMPLFSLTVALSPQKAINNGAKWRVTSGPDTTWKNSGETMAKLPGGTYMVTYKDIKGWIKPLNQTITVKDGVLKSIIARYRKI